LRRKLAFLVALSLDWTRLGLLPEEADVQKIAFLALSQAHQHLHWLPAALRLAHRRDVEVTVLSASRAMLKFVRSYDLNERLKYRRLWVPSLSKDGLFTPPKRRLTVLMHHRTIGRFPTIVTTETTSSLLYKMPGFHSRMIHLKHGAGDREGGYNPKHAHFDLTLVNGQKDKERLISRGLATESNCIVVGYAKFELVRAPSPVFAGSKPLALYNPHFDPKLSAWFEHGPQIISAMERIPDWNFVVAPHVKLKRGPEVITTASNVIVDPGSIRSIDMSYTEAAGVYIGDVSSQVYEFLRRPRPCVFLNLGRVDWSDNENYAHWKLGQVIESLDELEPALRRAGDLQPVFEAAQRAAVAKSMRLSDEPASERQAEVMLTFAEGALTDRPHVALRDRILALGRRPLPRLAGS
jgi:hypothetical protein